MKINKIIGFVMFMILGSISLLSGVYGVQINISSLDIRYEFENNFLDTSGNNHTATNSGTEFVASKNLFFGNYAVDFESSESDYIDSNTDLTYDNAVGWSMGLLFKSESNTGTNPAIFRQSGVGNEVQLLLSSANSYNYYIYVGNTDTDVSLLANVSPNVGSWDCVVNTIKDGEQKIYVNGILVASDNVQMGTTSPTGNMFIGSNDGGSQFIDGVIDEYFKTNYVLNQTEIESYCEFGINKEIVEEVRTESVYQVTQEDLIIINANNTWTTIIEGDFSLAENFTNYGSTTIQTLSTILPQTNFSCRTLIDDVPTGDDVNRTNINGQIGSMTLLRPDVEIAGTYNVKVQCQKNGGTTFINYTNGIGHVFNNSEVTSFDFNNTFFINGNNQTLQSEIITSPYDGYLILESSGTINSSNDADLEIYFKTNDSQQCGVSRRSLEAGTKGSIGGVCALRVLTNQSINLSLEASGQNISLTGLSHAKILTYANSTPIIITNITQNSTLIGRVNVSNVLDLDKVFMKANIPINDSNQTINLQFVVDGNNVSQAIPYTAGDIIKQSIQQYVADAPSKDWFYVDLYASSVGAPVTTIQTQGGNILAYTANEYDLNSTFVRTEAYNYWNGTQILNFNVTDGVTIYSTTDGSINIFTSEPFLNLSFSSDTYIDRTFLNHNTSNDLNATLYQTIINLISKEIYTNNSINNFSIQTEVGNFSTTNGTLTIFPNIGNYTWNVTFDTYFNKTNYVFNITQSETITIDNVIDKIINFKNNLGQLLSPECLWLGNILTSDYEFAAQNNNSILSCSLFGYSNFSKQFTSPYPEVENITLNRTTLNMRMFDSETLTQIYFNVTLSNATDSITLLNQFDLQQNFTDVPTGEFSALVSSEGYSNARFFNTLTPFTSITIDGYLTTSSEVILFNTRDSVNDKPLGIVLIEVQQLINGSLVTLVQAQTSDDGQAFVYLDPSKEYQFIFTKTGYDQTIVNSIPGVTSYIARLQETGVEFDFFTDVNTIFYPSSSVLYNNQTYNLSAFITGSSLTSIVYSVYDQNDTLLFTQTSTNPTGTTFTFEFTPNGSITSIRQVITYYRNGDSATEQANYKVVTLSDSFIQFLKNDFVTDKTEDSSIVRWLVMILTIGSTYLIAQTVIAAGGLVSAIVIGFFVWIAWIPTPIGAVLGFGALVLWLGGRR